MTSANTCRCAEIQNRIGLNSQLRKVMDHLRLKGNISQMEAYNLYQVTRLTSRICELKKMGLDIVVERKVALNGVRYVRYFLL